MPLKQIWCWRRLLQQHGQPRKQNNGLSNKSSQSSHLRHKLFILGILCKDLTSLRSLQCGKGWKEREKRQLAANPLDGLNYSGNRCTIRRPESLGCRDIILENLLYMWWLRVDTNSMTCNQQIIGVALLFFFSFLFNS